MTFTGFFDDYDKSIKNEVVEEKYDLYFSRPIGYILAKFFSKLGFTPTNISVLGMLIGVYGGVMLYWQGSLLYTLIAGLCITFAGVMDSADGQAARIYGTGSEMGKYLDMVNDTLVFISCYAAGIHFFIDDYTIIGVWIIGLASGFVHGLKANIYEYSKGELLHFTLTDSTHRFESVEHIRKTFDRTSSLLKKMLFPLVIDYVKTQNRFKSRSNETTAIFEQARAYDPEEFKDIYTQYNRKVLTAWAWVCGSNITRNSIILSSLFGRFDIFAFANIGSFALFKLVGQYQKKIDKQVLEVIKDWNLDSLDKTTQPK